MRHAFVLVALASVVANAQGTVDTSQSRFILRHGDVGTTVIDYQAKAIMTAPRRDSAGHCYSWLVVRARPDSILARLPRCPTAYEDPIGILVEWMVQEIDRLTPRPRARRK